MRHQLISRGDFYRCFVEAVIVPENWSSQAASRSSSPRPLIRSTAAEPERPIFGGYVPSHCESASHVDSISTIQSALVDNPKHRPNSLHQSCNVLQNPSVAITTTTRPDQLEKGYGVRNLEHLR